MSTTENQTNDQTPNNSSVKNALNEMFDGTFNKSMTRQQKEVVVMDYVLKGIISQLPQEEQEKVKACIDQLRSTVESHGDIGMIAFTVFSTEVAARAA